MKFCEGFDVLTRRLLVPAAAVCSVLSGASAASADMFHGMNAGAVIWDGQILLTPQKASDIAVTGTNALRVNFRLHGDVELDDFNRLALGFGTNAGWAGGDFTGNGLVNHSDLNTLKTYFGFKAPTGGQPIPEPNSLAILGLIMLGCSRVRKH